MPRIRPILAAIAVVALAFPALADAKIVVHKRDSGKTITLAPGEQLVVKLTECAPCGYSWRYGIPPDKRILKRTRSTYTNPPGTNDNPPTVGGAGTRSIFYVGKASGRTKLRLDYFGPGGGAAADHFRLTIKVKAP